MGADDAVVAVLAAKFAEYRPHADERRWRVYLGSEARAHAALYDCPLSAAVSVVAAAAGVSRSTVAAGAGELAVGAGPLRGRQGRAGAGRPKADGAQPGLSQALDGVLEDGTCGDPMREIAWTTLSLRGISRRLRAEGFEAGKDAVSRMMRARGYSLQGMSRVLEGKQHPDRDRQFRHVNAMIAWFREHGLPVISVDGKKKEQLGPFRRDGASWRPAGDPVQVRDHDFPDEELGKITPYGVYDIAANRGFVSVGTSHDTGAFAVNAIRLWWQEEGQFRYPGAGRLLITCDAGGSNGHRCRLWKNELAAFAAGAGLKISVCHFPPGTSKWNKIEHRMFCHITRTWKARPLMTAADAVAGITATVTAGGLKCRAVLDDRDYPGGIKISDRQMRYLERHVIIRPGPHPARAAHPGMERRPRAPPHPRTRRHPPPRRRRLPQTLPRSHPGRRRLPHPPRHDLGPPRPPARRPRVQHQRPRRLGHPRPGKTRHHRTPRQAPHHNPRPAPRTRRSRRRP